MSEKTLIKALDAEIEGTIRCFERSIAIDRIGVRLVNGWWIFDDGSPPIKRTIWHVLRGLRNKWASRLRYAWRALHGEWGDD